MKIYVVIDIGCHECGVGSEAVGAYATEAEALEAVEACDKRTGCWRDGGQTGAYLFEVEAPAVLEASEPDGGAK